jgi:hypothetical protein
MRSITNFLFCLFLFNLTSCPPCTEITAGELCGEQSVTVLTEYYGTYPLIHAKVNGVDSLLLIDTGAIYAAFSAERNGFSSTGWEMGETVVEIGEMTLSLHNAYFFNGPFTSSADGEINGLLGGEILADLDYRQTKIQITLSRESLDCDGLTIKTSKQLSSAGAENWQPFIDGVTVDEITIDSMLLDTGARNVLFSAETISELGAYIRDNSIPTGFCVFDGCVDSGAFESVANQVCVNDICIDSVGVKYPAWNAIGQSFLGEQDFIVSIRRQTYTVCD